MVWLQKLLWEAEQTKQPGSVFQIPLKSLSWAFMFWSPFMFAGLLLLLSLVLQREVGGDRANTVTFLSRDTLRSIGRWHYVTRLVYKASMVVHDLLRSRPNIICSKNYISIFWDCSDFFKFCIVFLIITICRASLHFLMAHMYLCYPLLK